MDSLPRALDPFCHIFNSPAWKTVSKKPSTTNRNNPDRALRNSAAQNQLFPGQPLEILRDFGPQPVSSRFSEKPLEGEFSMPMILAVCPRSGLLQLAHTFPPEELLPRVPWLTVFEPEGHLDALADMLATLPGLSTGDWVAGYSSKDDSLLRRLDERGFQRQWRLDPALDLGISNPCAFVETFQVPFVDGAATNAIARSGKPKLFLIRHVLEHSYDLLAFLRAARDVVHPEGYIIFEVPDCTRALETLDYTTLWEEHSVYFTPATLQISLTLAGLELVHCDVVPHPFESCMVAICRIGAPPEASVKCFNADNELKRARRFASEFEKVTANFHSHLEQYHSQGQKMALFGAGHLAVAFTSLHATAHFFDFVVDDNANKLGRHLAGSGLRIRPSSDLLKESTNLCLLAMNPEHAEKIAARNLAFIESGGRFGSIFPSSSRFLFS